MSFALLPLILASGAGNLTLPKVLDSLMVLQRAPKAAQVSVEGVRLTNGMQ